MVKTSLLAIFAFKGWRNL